ncbi:LuxR family transcriptional regulator [Palleronia sp. LCG004]|uniref:helix-turn-helix transcriptional regulator n=1 Tax=Palleronia sp. LCG004 TaxID=3079304 RepID=UPI002941D470|nr:LuxR family transcriptional regulator [Palleronia sp. LCG004]WOI56920.1 LuxR family transcriptional regulator [Palleronia sp. LCG004]
MEDHVTSLRDRLGLRHLLYHWVSFEGDVFGAGTYDAPWRQHYIAENFAKHDPVLHAAHSRFHPIDWSALDWSSKGAGRLLQHSQDAGIGTHGVTIPIRGPNGQFAHLTATFDGDDHSWADFKNDHGRDLILLAHLVNQRALEIQLDDHAEQQVLLSPREIDSLGCLARGYSRAQAAESLSISEHTLRVYIESARAKLRATNTTHAVAHAVKLGLVSI